MSGHTCMTSSSTASSPVATRDTVTDVSEPQRCSVHCTPYGASPQPVSMLSASADAGTMGTSSPSTLSTTGEQSPPMAHGRGAASASFPTCSRLLSAHAESCCHHTGVVHASAHRERALVMHGLDPSTEGTFRACELTVRYARFSALLLACRHHGGWTSWDRSAPDRGRQPRSRDGDDGHLAVDVSMDSSTRLKANVCPN
jgi:hypothetical protein